MTASALLAHPWFSTWLAAVIAVPLALVVHRIGGMLLLRMTRPLAVLHTAILKCRRAARVTLPLIALQLVWQSSPDDLRYIDVVRHANGLLLIAACCWFVTRVISGFADGVVAQHPIDVEDNMQARGIHTKTRVLARTAMTVIVVAGVSMMLMTFPGARQVGASLLASAGVIGIVAGLAAKPVFSNMIAGLQLALAQPIRLDDVLVVEGEWGRVEEITGTFVVLRIWDDRRLILPLSYFIEKPFQNWTRQSAQLLGSAFFYVDYSMPIAPLRLAVERIVRAAPQWDQRFFNLQVTDTTEQTMQLRVLCTAASSSLAFDLRCAVREGLIDFMQREFPQHLPRFRFDAGTPASMPSSAAMPHTG